MRKASVETISLSSDRFEFITQKTGWTRERYRLMDTGDVHNVPLYTAALLPVAHVPPQAAAPINASQKNPVISFAANGDGSAGTNFVYHVQPFYVSNDRTCLRVLDTRIDPYYVYYSLRDIKKIYGFDFQYKANPLNASLVTIDIPVDDIGNFDVEVQRALVTRFSKMQRAQAAIASQVERISTAVVAIDVPQPVEEVSLGDCSLFTTSIGKRELIKDSTTFGTQVISASVRKIFGYVDRVPDSDFESPSLIWGIDSIFDWNLIPAGRPFVPTDHCGVLKILHSDILPRYLYYALWSTRERYGFDRTFRASLGNVRALTVSIPTKDGTFNITRQAEIADRYEKINQTRLAILASLSRITEAIVDYVAE